MKRSTVFIFILLFFGFSETLRAQDTLPKFQLRNVGNNRIIIGWINQYPNIRQISIQRSFDSLSNFKTILTVADPKAVQNGFADTKAPNDHMFYRLFYAMEGGAFYFSVTKKPFIDSTFLATTSKNDQYYNNQVNDPALTSFIPSFYVYTNKNGYLQLNLPNPEQRKYTIKFYEEDGSFLFELKGIKDRSLTLDKANFFHAGWFHFELYNEDKIVEKHKFYISKDFLPLP